jgi:hypothetical protein
MIKMFAYQTTNMATSFVSVAEKNLQEILQNRE